MQIYKVVVFDINFFQNPTCTNIGLGIVTSLKCSMCNVSVIMGDKGGSSKGEKDKGKVVGKVFSHQIPIPIILFGPNQFRR